MCGIDFVIPAVDGSDPKWQKRFINNKAKETGLKETDISMARYRKGVDLRYWFRGVERYAPWVRKVHFITDNQLPDWINLDCPKLNWVKHSDYIPNQYLPVFSSHPIELNLHKIKDLSDHFVYFNDDLFLTKEIGPEYFFYKGLPTDMAILQPNIPQTDIMKSIIANDIELINKSFRKWNCLVRSPHKWFSLKYRKLLLRTISTLSQKEFASFWEPHLTHNYLKSTFDEVWATHGPILEEVCKHKFRNASDVNQWVFAYWQLAKGSFHPTNFLRESKPFYRIEKEIENIEDAIKNKKYKIILLNDSNDINDYDGTINRIENAFKSVLPYKSQFEK